MEIAQRLVGTYRLISFENFADDGEVQTPFGEHPRGFAIYTAEGYMSAILMVSDRDNFPEGDILAARVFEAECDAYPEAIRLFAEGRLLIKEGRLRID